MNQSAPTAQSTRQAVVYAESFRLLELPFDLLELLTLFFRQDEAVQLLTVSGGFHNLFAQSVWREVTKKTLAVAEPTRSAAYARYGRLVRTINLLFDTDAGYELHDWLALFPNIASLRTSSAMLPEQAQMLLAAITGLHGLGSVWIRFTNEARSLSLSDVADALLARHQNRAIRRLQLLNITIHDTDHATPWTTMSDFVQAIEPLNTVGLGIEMSAFRGHEIPTEEQMSLLRPYLIEVSDHDYGRATFDCVVPWNSSVFGQLNNQAVVYPNTNKLVLNICCTSELLDYSSIAPAMFPNLQALSLFTKSCEHAEPIDHEPVLVSILSHHWPHVIEFGVGTKVFGGCLDALVENNQQLTTLQVCGVMGPDNETASLDQVLFGLPHLLDLLISAPYIGTLSANWTEDNLTDIRNCPLESLVVGTDEITASYRSYECSGIQYFGKPPLTL
ncbi:hypothetical protein GQ42DRAFT_178569 [Ramicandelaber brevisporus]|nr:hypothetical protein GQ42DRAFT_178569 [Ramicandelaber brevisporus]